MLNFKKLSDLPKPCTKCGETKSVSEFAKARNGYRTICKVCINTSTAVWRNANLEAERCRTAAWARANPDYIRSAGNAWKKANPERSATNSRNYWLKTIYNLTPEGYATLLTEQGGKCAICGNVPVKKCLGVDHNHQTGAIRGLLCDDCNIALGKLKDSADLLRKAIEYLDGEKALGPVDSEVSCSRN